MLLFPDECPQPCLKYLRVSPGPPSKFAHYNGFRGVLNQKSIPSKTTEGPQRAAENPYIKTLRFLCRPLSLPKSASSAVLCDCQGVFTGIPASVIIRKFVMHKEFELHILANSFRQLAIPMTHDTTLSQVLSSADAKLPQLSIFCILF